MSPSKRKIELCETCKEREATVFPLIVRDGNTAYGKFCKQCYESQADRPHSLQDILDDLAGKPRSKSKDGK